MCFLVLGPPPEGAPLEAQDFGWANSVGTGNADDAVTSGLEVIWSKTPTKWSNGKATLFRSYLPHVLTQTLARLLEQSLQKQLDFNQKPCRRPSVHSFGQHC